MTGKPQVLLIGTGGVGVIAALSLETAGKSEVTAVVRTHYDLVVKEGYTIESCDYGKLEGWRPTRVVKSIEDAVSSIDKPFDYVIVATKCLPDITKTEDVIAKAITSTDTTIVLIQNGIDNEKPVIARFPGNVVLSGVSMIGSHNFGGRIEQHEPDALVVGPYINDTVSFEKAERSAKKFVEIYNSGKNSVVYDADVISTRWKKLVYNSCLNTICALVQLDVGRVELAGGNETLVRPAMEEIAATARKAGAKLEDDIVEKMIHGDDGLYYAPSMLVDVQKGNPIELEVILGNPLREAKELGVPTPVLSLVYELLKLVQFRLKEAAGYITVPEKRPSWTS